MQKARVKSVKLRHSARSSAKSHWLKGLQGDDMLNSTKKITILMQMTPRTQVVQQLLLSTNWPNITWSNLLSLQLTAWLYIITCIIHLVNATTVYAILLGTGRQFNLTKLFRRVLNVETLYYIYRSSNWLTCRWE